MPKYEVDMTVTVALLYSMEVEAEDEQAAVEKACDITSEIPSILDHLGVVMPEAVDWKRIRCEAWTSNEDEGFESEEDWD